MSDLTMTIQEMRNNPLTPIFPASYPFYTDNEEVRKQFEETFILYFLEREIGYETPYLFTEKLKGKLMEVMPYYQQLYQTEWYRVKSIELMMNSKNLVETTTHEQTLLGTSTNKENSSTKITQTSTDSGETSSSGSTKESRIDSGVSDVSLANGSLTAVGEVSDSSNTTNSRQGSQTGTNNGTATTNTNQTITDKTTFTSKGDIGIQTPAYAITEWRKIIININQLLLKECECLFLKIY